MPIIKRYANRKLYDTHAKAYVTLQDLAEMIRRGEDVLVLDHATGEDITSQVQAQIIFELERHTGSSLPNTVLTTLIQARDQTLNQLRMTFLPSDSGARVDLEIERRIRVLVENGDLGKKQAEELLAKLLAVRTPLAPSETLQLRRALEKRGVPTRAELAQLAAQIEELDRQIQVLSSKAKPKRTKLKSP